MGPAELAGLVAREAEAGVATALMATDASGQFVLERVVGRVGTREPGSHEPGALGEARWEAEFHLRHVPGGAVAVDGSPTTSVPAALTTLPVAAIRGVGPAWAERLSDLGVLTLGDLAALSPAAVDGAAALHGHGLLALVARARACAQPWPDVDRRDRRSVLDVARHDPGDVEGLPPGSRVSPVALWGHCLGLTACVDDDVLARLPVGGPA